MFDVPLHPFLVHFPITLGIFAFLYDSWAIYSKRPRLHDTGYSLSLWAALFALAAAGTGLQLSRLGETSRGALTGHALFGISAAIVLVAIALVRYSAKASEREAPRYSLIWLLVEAAAAALVIAAAFSGHRLV